MPLMGKELNLPKDNSYITGSTYDAQESVELASRAGWN